MNSIDHIIRIIAESSEPLRFEFGVAGIGIFGSVVRGEQGAGSDIDILVEFARPIGFVRFMRLEKRFAELLGDGCRFGDQEKPSNPISENEFCRGLLCLTSGPSYWTKVQ